MINGLLDPSEPVERQHERLLEIVGALMKRVEQDLDSAGAAYAQFERAVILEDQVQQRTAELEHTLELLNRSNAQLSEANLKAEAARTDLANAIETIQEGFALFNPDDALVLCNSRFGAQLRDVQAKLAPGLSFADYVGLVSQSPALVPPLGLTREDWRARRMRRHVDAHVMFNVELVRDHWLQVSEHRTPNGGTVILQTDITDVIRIGREEREKLLDEQARMVRATLDHLNQGVAIFDQAARLVGWNRRSVELLSLPPAQLHIGVTFARVAAWLRERFDVSDESVMRELAEWIGARGQPRPLSFTLTGRNGMILDGFARQMPDGGFVVSFTDVTAEREAALALSRANETLEQRVAERTLELRDALDTAERANASKTRFVAAASHDLLQPLSAAKLFLATAADERGSELLDKAANALVSMEGLIEALLDISKLDSGSATFEIADVALQDILQPLYEEFAPLAAAKGLDLRVVRSAASVRSDPVYLRRILQNLISNAIRYTHRGKVLVGPRRMGGSVRMEIWDTGPGISEEDREVIFQEFHRLDARASASEGMGLGLAIVERACDRLGHPLGLWSEPGQGSGFFINLTRVDATSRRAPEKRAPTSAPSRLKDQGMIVLLVEDDADLRRAMTVLLGRWDLHVIEARNAEEALSLLDEIQIVPDAQMIDYQLGQGQDGVALAEALRTRYGPVPSCILSANRSPDLRRICTQARLPLITKPIDAEQLERFLLSALVST